MDRRNPILVTGSPRSGTTWTGRMIAASPSVGYIHEPFTLSHRPGVCGMRFEYSFPYLTEENEAPFYEHIKNSLSFHYRIDQELRAIRSLKDIKRVLKDYAGFIMYRSRSARPLFKDAGALFSAEWLARRFGMDVIILVRHPAAFALSAQTIIKAVNWDHPYPSDFLKQPLLMRDHLFPFEAEIREHAAGKRDILDQLLLGWKIFYSVVLKYRELHPSWLIIRHEDLSQDPIRGFEEIFAHLGLEYSEKVRRVIQRHCDSSNPLAFPGAKTIMRNTRANTWNWKNRISNEERAYIKSRVEDISKFFYSDDEW